VALSLEFADELVASQIEQIVASLEKRIKERHPGVVALFIKPQSRRIFEAPRHERYLRPRDRARVTRVKCVSA
jgi:hypothetical protein